MFSILISSFEWKWAAIIISLFIVITFIPLLVGYSNISEQFFYPVSVSSPADTSTYLSWIEQVRQGDFLMKMVYSSAPQSSVLFHPLFFVLGLVAELLQVSNIFIYYFARSLGVIAFGISAYLFISLFFENINQRLITYVILFTYSGLGFIYGENSPDIWMAELSIFSNLSHTLLNSYSLALILLLLFICVSQRKKFDYNKLMIIFFLSSLLTLIHTYYIVLVLLVLALWTLSELVKNKQNFYAHNFIWLVLLAMPGILYQTYVLYNNPSLSIWAFMQTSVPGVVWYEYLIGFGLMLLFALLAILAYLLKERSIKHVSLLLSWLVVVGLIIVIPLFSRLERKYLEGVIIPLVILGSTGLFWLMQNIQIHSRTIRTTLLIILIIYMSLSNVILVDRDIKAYLHRDRPFRWSVGEHDALLWIKQNTTSQSVILSSYFPGNLIPAFSGRTVYIGHYDQTVNASLKNDIAFGVLSSKVIHRDPLKHFVAQERISHIFVDEEVRSWGGLDITNRDYLKLVFDNTDVQIYEVDQASLN